MGRILTNLILLKGAHPFADKPLKVTSGNHFHTNSCKKQMQLKNLDILVSKRLKATLNP